MTKDNLLFGIIGLLLGAIVGFMFANSVNQRGYSPQLPGATSSAENRELPSDHPPIASNGVADQPAAIPPAVAETITKARNEPTNFDAQMQAASLFYQIQRFDEAIEFLLKANQIKPDDNNTIVRLGDANFDAGHYETAEKWYSAALARNPDDVNVRTDLGLTFLFREPSDVDRAIKEFRASLQRDPKHELTLQNLAAALLKKGNTAEARATLDKLESVNPNNSGLAKLRADINNAQSSK